MYEFLIDDQTLYYPGDEECIIMDPEVNLTLNEAGSAEFLLPPENPYYDNINLRQTMITVNRDDTEIFCGEVREAPKDSDNVKHIYVVGELTFLHDSRQPQVEYGTITALEFYTAVIAAHNEQVEERKQFTVGYFSVPSGFNPINFYTDHNDTLDAIRSMLIDNLGGVLRIRKVNGVRYLDYITLAEYGSYNSQGINFGENLLEYAENYSANSVVTAIIPRGAAIEDDTTSLTRHVDISSVNNGKDYLINTSAVASFGKVWDIVDFDGITDPQELKEAGEAYLADVQYETMELNLSAADLSQLDSDIAAFGLGDRVAVYAEPYGMDRTFPVKTLTLHPQAPENDRIKLSENLRKKGTYTASANVSARATAATAKKENLMIKTVIMQEMANIVAQFTGSRGGYKLEEYNSDGLWIRTLYMDATSKASATNIMEFSLDGIRFFRGNAGEYTDSTKWKTAWTLGGAFCADFISTGTLLATLIKAGVLSDVAGNFSLNMETGALSAQRLSINSTNFQLTEAGVATMSGASINGGTIEQTSGVEKLVISDAIIKGKYNGVEVGLIDFSAETTYGGDSTVYHDLVIASKNNVRIEFPAAKSLYIYQGSTPVGYFDGRGWHGDVYGTVHDEA